MSRGAFVSFEGGEGAGKSLHIQLLAEFLAPKHEVVKLREPGGTAIGEEIRHILKRIHGEMDEMAELLLMNASRAQLVKEVIRPSLAQGKVILCDRFYDSSIAYQSYGRGISLDRIYQAVSLACSGLKPDLTFFINAKPDEGLKNVGKRGQEKKDRFDSEELDFHERVYKGYCEIAKAEPERVKVISYIHGEAGKMQDEIRKQTLDFLNRNL